MLRLPKLLKEDGILIFESWAEGNEKYAMAKDAKVGSCLKIWCRHNHRVFCIASGVARVATSQRVVGCPYGTLYSAAWWGRKIFGKMWLSSKISERARKSQKKENQQTSLHILWMFNGEDLCLLLPTSAHFCGWYVSGETAFRSKT